MLNKLAIIDVESRKPSPLLEIRWDMPIMDRRILRIIYHDILCRITCPRYATFCCAKSHLDNLACH
jgi:hypothetical protein